MSDVEFIVTTINIGLFGIICFFVGWKLATEKMKRIILSQAGKLMVNIELSRFLRYGIPLKFDFSTHLHALKEIEKREKRKPR